MSKPVEVMVRTKAGIAPDVAMIAERQINEGFDSLQVRQNADKTISLRISDIGADARFALLSAIELTGCFDVCHPEEPVSAYAEGTGEG